MAYVEWDEALLGPAPYTSEKPLDVPEDYKALYEQYGTFVAAKVRNYNRVEGNFEDLVQDVWTKLMAADVLNKFHTSGSVKLPMTMTTVEALSFLGITEGVWKGTLFRFPHCIDPIAGKKFGRTAVFWTVDILDLDLDYLGDKTRSERVRPRMTAKGFKAYLEQAVHNAFANFCRTRNRKHRDHPIAHTTGLVPTSAGEYRRSADLENQTCWEDSITEAMTLDREDIIDLARQIQKANIDLGSEQGAEVLDLLVKQGKSCNDGPQRNIDTLTLIGQGYSLTEAVKKAQAKSKERLKRQQQAAFG